jgi:RimJ/RimL family protein N-acetyltransferase
MYDISVNGELKIQLVPFTREHMTERYRSWFNDQKVTEHNSHGLFPYTKEKMERFLKNIEDGGPDIILAILVREYDNTDDCWMPPKHIGNCSIQSINWVNRSCELAFVIGDTSYWGRGICSRIGQVLISHAIRKLNMHRVWTGTAATNTGMRCAAVTMGMEQEGIFRDGMWLDGKFVNVVLFSYLSK